MCVTLTVASRPCDNGLASIARGEHARCLDGIGLLLVEGVGGLLLATLLPLR